MKLLHLSDLHLGKRVNGFSMLEDQRFILKQILDIIRKEEPEAVLIAGDIYDKPVPGVEAMNLLDNFLQAMTELGSSVLMISGNHDSAERVAFGQHFFQKNRIYIAPSFEGEVFQVDLEDAYGPIHFYLLPFVKPANIRGFYPDQEIHTYSDGIRVILSGLSVKQGERNVLMTHQFVAGGVTSDSEELSVGGTDQVEAELLEDFDYVALGHLHRPQQVGKETIRYCGTPLKYSFSEAKGEKSVTVVEMKKKGDISVRTVPLTPLHDMREIRGTYLELTNRKNYEGTQVEDYLSILLTEEEDIPDAIRKLGIIYPNIMKLGYENARTRSLEEITLTEEVEKLSPMELFGGLYEKQNGKKMSAIQEEWLKSLMEEIWEEKE